MRQRLKKFGNSRLNIQSKMLKHPIGTYKRNETDVRYFKNLCNVMSGSHYTPYRTELILLIDL